MRNEESRLKAKVAGQNKSIQLLGFLSLAIIISLIYKWKHKCLSNTAG